MLIFTELDGIHEKIVLFDLDETRKTRYGIEIKPDEDYQIVGYSNENHAPIFLGLVVGRDKNTLHVASTNTRLDSFLSEFV